MSKKINIKALEGTNMVPGKVYAVSDEAGKTLVKQKRAVLAKTDTEKVGGIYDYPKASKTVDPTK